MPVVPPVQFAEKPSVREFDTDEEDSEDEERPKMQVGEDTTLEDDDDVSVSTEDEIAAKATETVALNL
jgi:hypothetical protein